jgi:hypothetical protein
MVNKNASYFDFVRINRQNDTSQLFHLDGNRGLILLDFVIAPDPVGRGDEEIRWSITCPQEIDMK